MVSSPAQLAPGNLDASYSNFVGRSRELRQLHSALIADKVGVVGALHGLGGQGKTALAVQYAYAYAGHYAAGGRWLLSCEGKAHLADALEPLIALMGLETPQPPQGLSDSEARAFVVKSVVDGRAETAASFARQGLVECAFRPLNLRCASTAFGDFQTLPANVHPAHLVR